MRKSSTTQNLHGLLIDAAGTLLELAEPVGETYCRFANAHQVALVPAQASRDFRSALNATDRGAMQGDGRPFWRQVVQRTTGSRDPKLFEDLYAWYARPEAWRVTPGWRPLCESLRGRGVRLGLLSNWDTRLRPLLAQLGVSEWLPVQIISGEEGLEKPSAAFYHLACARIDVPPEQTLMVGDSSTTDIHGAQAAGLRAAHWGQDLHQPQDLLAHFSAHP